MELSTIKVIGFDADDTLWENETFFREAEHQFAMILADYMSEEEIMHELYQVELANMPLYGYGIKAFILSLIETGCLITNNQITADQTNQIIAIGKNMMNKPVKLLDGIEKVLETLSQKYRLIVATKGDLLDQERKLSKSGLIKYFHHIEIMSDKHHEAYWKLIRHLDCEPSEFLMVGNSVKSDVLPVEEIGGYGIHVPFHTTWQHEVVENHVKSDRVIEVESVKDVLKIFNY
nr:HAD family hydrolase [uncultured Carboxylicivirga sp.]